MVGNGQRGRSETDVIMGMEKDAVCALPTLKRVNWEQGQLAA
jgi:hypothetical protein